MRDFETNLYRREKQLTDLILKTEQSAMLQSQKLAGEDFLDNTITSSSAVIDFNKSGTMTGLSKFNKPVP